MVTDLTADGVNIAVYYWINTNENRPMDVFDEAATAIKESLDESRYRDIPAGLGDRSEAERGNGRSEPLKRKSAI